MGGSLGGWVEYLGGWMGGWVGRRHGKGALTARTVMVVGGGGGGGVAVVCGWVGGGDGWEGLVVRLFQGCMLEVGGKGRAKDKAKRQGHAQEHARMRAGGVGVVSRTVGGWVGGGGG